MNQSEAFTELWEKYLPKIKSLTFSYPERHREDLMQEGLIALEQACATFDETKSVPFDAYATLCIKRRIATAFKTLGKDDSAINIEDNDFTDPRFTTEAIVERKYTESFFSELRNELTKLEKAVLSEYLKDKTYDQIAQTLGITVKAVDNALSRIKKKIKEKYDI